MFGKVYRFTPPTCTLEIKTFGVHGIVGSESDRFHKLQFKLSFDDPRLSSSQQAMVVGDRQDLNRFKIIVDKYIQNFLSNPLRLAKKFNSNSENSLQFDRHQIHLQSQGMVNHELFFGNLKTDSKEEKIILSSVQLFDLFTALEGYYNTYLALKQTTNRKLIPLWGAALASTVSLATVILLSQPSTKDNIVTASKSQPSTETPQFDRILPPQIPTTASESSPQPKINRSWTSTKKLSPPQPVDPPQAPKNILNSGKNISPKIVPKSDIQQEKPQKNILDRIESIIPISPEKTDSNPPTNSVDSFESDRSLSQPIELESITSVNKEDNIAFNNIPSQPNTQQEMTTYFRKRWQPPEDLKQSLEYRLRLNKNGSISRVIPIGKASQLYLQQTPIPLREESFISPLDIPQKATFRLLLNPDGLVKVLAE